MERTCLFTGHRDIPSGVNQLIFTKTEEVVESLIEEVYLYFCAGSATTRNRDYDLYLTNTEYRGNVVALTQEIALELIDILSVIKRYSDMEFRKTKKDATLCWVSSSLHI